MQKFNIHVTSPKLFEFEDLFISNEMCSPYYPIEKNVLINNS